MPQAPAIVTASFAIGKERAGRRGSAPAPRHERTVNPDDAPDVSVDSYHHHFLSFIASLPSLLFFLSLA
jgi:hypothetical protein